MCRWGGFQFRPSGFYEATISLEMGCLGGKEMFRRVLMVFLILAAALAIFLMSQYADTALYFIQKCLAASVVHYVL
jgi:hypothetical protein